VWRPTETAAASALRRSALTGEHPAVARVCDLPAVVPSLLGKVEFEVDEEGRELEVLAHLLRKATAETFRHHLGASDLKGLIERFDEGLSVESGDLVPGRRLLEQVGPFPGLARVLDLLGVDEGAETPSLPPRAGVRPRGAVPQPADLQGRRPDRRHRLRVSRMRAD
jgi:magnesium chelatase subunit I